MNELDAMAETFGKMVVETYGKEIELFYQMVVMDKMKVELYYQVHTEGFQGMNWM